MTSPSGSPDRFAGLPPATQNADGGIDVPTGVVGDGGIGSQNRPASLYSTSSQLSVVRRSEVYNDRLSFDEAEAALRAYLGSHVRPQPTGEYLQIAIKEFLRAFCVNGSSELTNLKGHRDWTFTVGSEAGDEITFSMSLGDMYAFKQHRCDVDLGTFLRSFTQLALPIVSELQTSGLWYSWINPRDIKNTELRDYAMRMSVMALTGGPGGRQYSSNSKPTQSTVPAYMRGPTA